MFKGVLSYRIQPDGKHKERNYTKRFKNLFQLVIALAVAAFNGGTDIKIYKGL